MIRIFLFVLFLISICVPATIVLETDRSSEVKNFFIFIFETNAYPFPYSTPFLILPTQQVILRERGTMQNIYQYTLEKG